MEAFMLPGQTDIQFHHNNTPRPSENARILPLLSLKGRTAIITGAGSGIGLAIAEAFAEAGANVAIWYNSNKDAIEKAENLAKTYGVKCKAYKVLITEEVAVTAAIDEAVRDLNGRLDIFVGNAGMTGLGGPVIDADTDLCKTVFDVNFWSVYYAAKAAGAHFRRQQKEQTTVDGKPLENYSSGSFIITTSISGMRPLMPQATTPYGITKAALIHLAKSLAIEWIQFARINCVSPAYFTTDLLNVVPDPVRDVWKSRTPMGREGSVSELKGAYLYLASDAASYTTGINLPVDGGYTLC